ncbi:MAG: N-acetylmuramoyl-L-alanine amidase [Saprospiraceae bacterium]|nr:N-acetylmuramoyl-L-alanine amidase [Saprospiraceae bacterium]
MKKAIALTLLMCIALIINAQQRAEIEFTNLTEKPNWQTAVLEVPLVEIKPFLAYSVSWKGEANKIKIRFSYNGIHWSSWTEVGQDKHSDGTNLKVTQLGYVEKDVNFFQIAGEQTAKEVVLHLYNPGATEERPEDVAASEVINSRTCECTIPSFQDRAGWCPSGTCPEHPDPAFTNVSHLIIHHSAGTNISDDWAAVVRSIWDFHVNTRGWSDIGYNWLIDPDGVVYQGRGNDWIGAHFCGANSNTMGVCVLGNFTTEEPTIDAEESLKELLAWKSCESSIDPEGVSFHSSTGMDLDNISGHKDGCATACPGEAFYPSIPDLRAEVADYIASNCQTTDVEIADGEFAKVKYYPNPTQGEVKVELPASFSGMRLELINLSSKELHKAATLSPISAHQTYKLDLTPYPAGMYLIRLEGKGKDAVFKLVKN